MPAPRPGLAILRHPHLDRVASVFGTAALGLVVAGAAVAENGLLSAALGLGYGLIWWSFIEYLLHRWVLHWEPASPRGRAIRRLLPGHRSHHNGPQDPDDVVSRKHAFALPLGAVLFGGMLVLGFAPGFALAAVGGGALGYAAYEYVHFACHQLPMTSRLGRVLRRHHAIHHHRDETVNFGVTSPLWDHVFGTVWRG